MSRIAHAVRGLKYPGLSPAAAALRSHCSRGAWIEITLLEGFVDTIDGRIAHAVRGLKSARQTQRQVPMLIKSHRSRGAWIEIGTWASIGWTCSAGSHRSRGAWIEIL